jgi:hypothetical protein
MVIPKFVADDFQPLRRLNAVFINPYREEGGTTGVPPLELLCGGADMFSILSLLQADERSRRKDSSAYGRICSVVVKLKQR